MFFKTNETETDPAVRKVSPFSYSGLSGPQCNAASAVHVCTSDRTLLMMGISAAPVSSSSSLLLPAHMNPTVECNMLTQQGEERIIIHPDITLPLNVM